jgi:tripartite-type tricarboxylate transporter receptor subunit TctC
VAPAAEDGLGLNADRNDDNKTRDQRRKSTMPKDTPVRLGIAMAALLAAGAARGQDDAACDDFPDRALTLVTAAGPASSMDITSRQIAEPLSRLAGVAVNVVNKAGGGGSLAYNHLRAEPHDGYTILTISRSVTLHPYTSDSDFDPEMVRGVAQAVSDWEVLIADTDSEWQTAGDFVAAARAAAQPVVMSGPSVGSVAHITASEFARSGEFEFSYVPSPSGGEAMVGVMGGHIPAAFSEPAESWSQREGGEIRYLGVASPERLDFMPDVPTMREQGYDFVSSNWRAFVVAAETPDCVLEKLEALFDQAIHSDEFVSVVESNRSSIDYIGAADFSEQLLVFDKEAEAMATSLGIR